MKVWQRAFATALCGGPCGGRIEKGQPVLILTIGNLPPRKRCVTCAGEPVGTLIDAPMHEPAEPLAFRPVSELAQRFDSRMAQAGKDGE